MTWETFHTIVGEEPVGGIIPSSQVQVDSETGAFRSFTTHRIEMDPSTGIHLVLGGEIKELTEEHQVTNAGPVLERLWGLSPRARADLVRRWSQLTPNQRAVAEDVLGDGDDLEAAIEAARRLA